MSRQGLMNGIVSVCRIGDPILRTTGIQTTVKPLLFLTTTRGVTTEPESTVSGSAARLCSAMSLKTEGPMQKA